MVDRKEEKGCISAPEQILKKIKALFFLQLLKFEKKSGLIFSFLAKMSEIEPFFVFSFLS